MSGYHDHSPELVCRLRSCAMSLVAVRLLGALKSVQSCSCAPSSHRSVARQGVSSSGRSVVSRLLVNLLAPSVA